MKSIKKGKIHLSDELLVREQGGVQWIPIQDIDQFKFEANEPNGSSTSAVVSSPGDIFDHVRQPGFNLSAFCYGAFWYFLHKMPAIGRRKLIVTIILMFTAFAGGILLEFTPIPITLLLLAVWSISALHSAWRADHDLNLLQIKRFHQETTTPHDEGSGFEHIPLSEDDIVDLYIPTLREKILN
ncbi:hypothetical protein CEE37_13860 [candidate division LCP-89 bacterium B3_LCP]|uniref:DUF2628 domain-containing protein n=1 Tax=candidate division LCP-89 bacterium B3_LCP TaxID=2012998 RepID=A0A532URN4_UNCL8|nr:MAG: hypothetical protein CEE37_13860 [candidate division LCP-89 bacterium B3_LCP]